MADFALVIPAYEEDDRLPPFAADLATCVAASPLADRVQIRVIDDGSPAASHERLQEALANQQDSDQEWQIAYDGKNRGKGGAVFWGWDQLIEENQQLSHLAFVDADGSVPAEEVVRLLLLAENSPEVCHFASRIKMMGRTVERRLLRHLVGRVFTTMLSVSLKLPVYDSQCGLKVLPRAAYEQVRERVSVHGFAFDVELLTALVYAKQEVREVPIDWRDCPGSKVGLIRDSFNMAGEILRIRRRAQNGYYQ